MVEELATARISTAGLTNRTEEYQPVEATRHGEGDRCDVVSPPPAKRLLAARGRVLTSARGSYPIRGRGGRRGASTQAVSRMLLASNAQPISPSPTISVTPASVQAVDGGPVGLGSSAASDGNASRESSARRDLELLEKTVEEQSTTINQYKKDIYVLETKLEEQSTDMRALRLSFGRAEEEGEALRQENESLKRANQDLLSRVSSGTNRKAKKCVDGLMEALPAKFVAVALTVDKELVRWARKEVFEIDPLKDEPVRLWKGRAEIVTGNGILTRCGAHVIPKCPLSLAGRGEYYTCSTTSVRALLENVCTGVIGKYYCSQEIIPAHSVHDASVSISSNGYLLQRMRQCLSDASSARKRVARDSFFESMGFNRLVSRYIVVSAEDKISKGVEVETAKRKLMNMLDQDLHEDCSWWRTGPLEQLVNVPCAGRATSTELIEEFDVLRLFRDPGVVDIYHCFLGYVPRAQETPAESSILSLARLDAWLCAVVALGSFSDQRGGARQKMYADKFHSMLQLSIAQLIGTVRQFVEYWHPEELKIPEQGGDVAIREKAVLEMERDATLVLKSRDTGKYYIALKSSWFQRYITTEMGEVHDIYLATFDDEFSAITLLGNDHSTYALQRFYENVEQHTVSANLLDDPVEE